ncbi:gamma-glutamyl-gamma-aminobutyrate hydrolase family protein [Limibaculum sp. FT325]|uniref:gamma-glutamyl-gamma-aminobutyrate hydrolase family protein n=1 Tax=Thermohalobaculum sediminis TaxID=2939436 RepID=UPI0020BEF2C0|nr:gamma-glutamyl-gamma-aminobutyrate hydrolase family protein [Limibaculum sediminis]MCL5778010.1 gamma-glutamyl-gamma-aminobutyrate hydrolase family protein [Limibaculum sediminis]
MNRPVVGVSANAHLIEESYRVQGSGERTIEAVAAVADAVPMILPGLPGMASTGELVDLLDGLVLTGARPNVHPEFYGEAETEAHGPFDRGRDGVTLPLLRAMIEAGKPVFGICRGIQEMNVAFGGTLHPEIRDLPGRMNHRMPKGEKDHGVIFAKRHLVRFREGGAFHRLLGATETVTNSLHGQAVWTAGRRVLVEGHAEDGTVEAIAIEGAQAFALGVQWHAEYDAAADPVSRVLFEAFGADARKARAARRGRRGAA